MIPKKIHYIWLGESPLPAMVEKCIESWSQRLPDYEKILWNEKNIDIQNPSYKKALKARKWAFAADIARLHILLEHGGIYLDTDIEIIKDLTPLLNTDLFIGYQDNNLLNAAIVGSVPGNDFIRDSLAAVIESLKSDYIPIPNIMTGVYNKNKSSYMFKHEVYPQEYFYPYNPFESEVKNLFHSDITKNTYAIHHWDHSWKGGLIERAYRKIRRTLKSAL